MLGPHIERILAGFIGNFRASPRQSTDCMYGEWAINVLVRYKMNIQSATVGLLYHPLKQEELKALSLFLTFPG